MSEENFEKLEKETADGKLVWHYTTWECFESILNRDELWASDWRFMNDKMELLHALYYCRDKYQDQDMSHISNLIQRLLSPNDLPLAAFVLSTSTAFDSLEQWRGYGQSSIGVSLGFDDARLTKILAEQGMQRQPCVYYDEQKSTRVESFTRQATSERVEMQRRYDASDHEGQRHNLTKGIGYSYGSDMARFMQQQALTFKDHRFHNEAEIRFISDFLDVGSQLGGLGWGTPYAAIAPERAYRRRDKAVMPYVKLKLSATEYVADKGSVPIQHPLVGILLGPSSEPQILSQESRYNVSAWIASFKRSSTLSSDQVRVAVSKVPLRA